MWDAEWRPGHTAMHATPTNITINGEPNELPPLDPFARGFREPPLANFTLSAEQFGRAVHWHNRTLDAWATAAAKVAPSVVILGMSVTAGCNTGRMFTADGQFVPLPGRQGACVAGNGWARLIVDHLRWQLSGAHDAVVDASVWYKNAVPPDFFAKCTGRYIADGPGIVLLEVCTTAWGGEKQLVRLISAIRRVSPRKAVSFICWLPQKGGHAQVALVRRVAEQEGADVLDMEGILRGRRGLYGDAIHPNLFGHGILAASAARFVAQGLMRGGSRACGGGGAAARHEQPADAGDKVSPEGQKSEFCFSSADEIPVLPPAATSTWAIVDEGGEKGVRKLGWVSTRIGDELTIGPIPKDDSEDDDTKCAPTRIELGYLMSASRDHQGAIDIACDGCDCASIAAPFANLYPFPRLHTDARRSNAQEAASVVGMNASVTVATSFDALQHDRWKGACYIKVRHAFSPHNRPSGRQQGANGTSSLEPLPATPVNSRIRIDSVVMRRIDISPAYVGYSWVRGNDGRGGPRWLMRQAAPCFRASAHVQRTCREAREHANSTSTRNRSWSIRFFDTACSNLELI